MPKMTDEDKIRIAAEIFVDFDRVIKELTVESYQKYLNGETRSTRTDKWSLEYINDVFGNFNTAMNYYYIFRRRNNLDKIC